MNINNIPGHGNGISAFFTSSKSEPLAISDAFSSFSETNNDRKNINIEIRKSKNKDKKSNEAYDHHCTTKVN